MDTEQENQLVPKILPGSKEWTEHVQRMKDLKVKGFLYVRPDSKKKYRADIVAKIGQPKNGKMPILLCNKNTSICHLSDLEVISSVNCNLVEVRPNCYTLSATVEIER